MAGESSPGEPEEYFTFMTPEAYNAVNEWMNYRASFGEEIIGDSWVMRDTNGRRPILDMVTEWV